jgi:uncharacterized protein YndB with AHSA1/START domain
MAESQFVYVTYIRTTPEKLWQALTEPEFTRKFWMGTTQESDWRPGSSWRLIFPDGMLADSGEILEFDPPEKLVLKWRNELFPEMTAEGYSRMTYTIEQQNETVKFTVTHLMEKGESKFIQAVSNGWPIILSSLKSLLETGESIVMTRTPPKFSK